MTISTALSSTQLHNARDRLRLLMSRFPRGLDLSREDLILLGYLYLYEQTIGSRGIYESEMRWLIPDAQKQVGMEFTSPMLPLQFIQRLMRFGILRVTITDSVRSGYRLTCLGRTIAMNLIEQADYNPEQLNVLFSHALTQAESSGGESTSSLLKFLEHVFLGAIREKVEYKIFAIDEDLQERKKEVSRAYSGHSENDFENAIANITYCRVALTELVDAVQESSACAGLEKFLNDWMLRQPEPVLTSVLEQSLDFLYVLRARVDAMLKDVVQFIHDCIAFRSLAITLDARDRLCRIQESILAHALENDIRMPVIQPPKLPRMDMKWKRHELNRPVMFDMSRVMTIENFSPGPLPSIEPEWKIELLTLARAEWQQFSEQGGVDLGLLLGHLAKTIPAMVGSLSLAVYFLVQDWPNWTPGLSLNHLRGQWISLGEDWMLEAVFLSPIRHAA